MKVVLAPDKFAGTLSAAEAAAAMAQGWRRARPDDELALTPMADGGEGTIAVVESAVAGCERVSLEVADARGRATTAWWLRLPDGTGLVETALACGLSQLPEDERDPRTATTYGVGQLIGDAVAAGVARVVVGLGGSATVDGGGGMAIALGHRLLRADGNGVKVGGQHLRELHRIAPAGPLHVPLVAAVDVETRLLGPGGAVEVFAPQKGAKSEDLSVLDEALRTLADVVERDLPGGPWRDLPGSGAAGGLGFGLAAFCGGSFEPGAQTVARLVGLDAAVAGAAVVVTGEGRLDAQSAAGKAPHHVLDRARGAGAKALAVAGSVADGAEAAFDDVTELGPDGLHRAAELVADRTAELASRLSGL